MYSCHRYTSTLDSIEGMADLEIGVTDDDASSKLHLLYGTNGDQVGQYTETVEIHEGVDTTFELSGELSTKVHTKATASGNILAAEVSETIDLEAAASIRAANSYKQTTHTTRTISLNIDHSRSSYVYQLKTDVQLTNDRPVTLWGGYFSSSRPLI